MDENYRIHDSGRAGTPPDWVFEGHLAVQAIENLPHGLRLGLTTVETPAHVASQRDPRLWISE